MIKSIFMCDGMKMSPWNYFFFKPSGFIILRQEKLTSLKQNNQTHPPKLKLMFILFYFLHHPKAAEVTQ